MPSRAETFRAALRSIIDQVDRLYLYLDGHPAIPDEVRSDPRIVPILSRDVGGLHANGKLLGLALERGSFIYISVDDDFAYSRSFIKHLRTGLTRYEDRAVVGYHGVLLKRPFARYNVDRNSIPYESRPREDRMVDAIGTGAAMFSSDALRFDVRDWRHVNMVDLCLAMEANKAGLPMVCLARRRRRMTALAEKQPDSIHARLLLDDSRQTELAHELLRFEPVRAGRNQAGAGAARTTGRSTIGR
ncbi:MAG TPA: hypothetical protein VFY21_12495 [Xanthobacteraceae bacterium]|nr:hypothetical protein [Xanthobacteraceae bacterium]